MKRYKIFIVLLTSLFILVACGEEKELVKVELEFIALEKESSSNKGKAIFESDSENTYYQLELSAYEYNNWSLKEGEKLTVEKIFREPTTETFLIDNTDPFAYVLIVALGTKKDIGIWKAVLDGKEIELREVSYYMD